MLVTAKVIYNLKIFVLICFELQFEIYILFQGDCVLPLPAFHVFTPLIFSQEGNLLPTNNLDETAHYITIPSNTEVTLSCSPNFFKKVPFNASKTLSVRCKDSIILGMVSLFKFRKKYVILIIRRFL